MMETAHVCKTSTHESLQSASPEETATERSATSQYYNSATKTNWTGNKHKNHFLQHLLQLFIFHCQTCFSVHVSHQSIDKQANDYLDEKKKKKKKAPQP